MKVRWLESSAEVDVERFKGSCHALVSLQYSGIVCVCFRVLHMKYRQLCTAAPEKDSGLVESGEMLFE